MCVPATRGTGVHDEQLANFEPGSDLVARVTVLADGTQGHLTNVALDHFGLRGDAAPQVWELGVKEVWKVPRPLDRVIHTMGWPLRPQAKSREFGGSFIYPMGDDLVAIGMVVGLDYRDPKLNPHDLLQVLKTHPTVRAILEGGDHVSGAPRPSRRRVPRPAPSAPRARSPALRRRGRHGQRAHLEGCALAVESGRLAAEAAFAAVSQAADDTPIPDAALASYDDTLRDSFIWKELYEVRDLRQVFGHGFFVGGALGMINTITKGRVSIGSMATEPDDDAPLLPVDDAAPAVTHDGVLTFDRLTSMFASATRTRRPAQPLARPHARRARRRRVVGEPLPGAGLHRRPRRRRRSRRGGAVTVELRAVRRHRGQGWSPHAHPKAAPARSTGRPDTTPATAFVSRTSCVSTSVTSG